MTEQNSNTQVPESSRPAAERRSDADRRRSVLDRRTGLDRRRRSVQVPVERRAESDRRKKNIQVSIERRSDLDRRRGPGIRREEDRRAAEEGEMTDEQFEFVMAVDTYKRANNRPFPTLTEILEVIQALGYRKID